jgi:hypothetical protein
MGSRPHRRRGHRRRRPRRHLGREAYCPADALFVAPLTRPAPPDSPLRAEAYVTDTGLLGSYRRELGWGRGRKPGARTAVGPELGRARITPAPARGD